MAIYMESVFDHRQDKLYIFMYHKQRVTLNLITAFLIRQIWIWSTVS